MAEEKALAVSCTMNEGNGPQSYAQNSYYQRKAMETTKEIIEEEIMHKLDVQQLSTGLLPSFHIADFGSATGPNTFIAMGTILQAIENKVKSEGLNSPEFQVFFNDRVTNDFNTLFSSLPSERRYYAAGVPGSFYGVLFPKASLHFAHSAFALNWLSELPKEVTNKTSPAWNGGRIHYSGARKEVVEAYLAQFNQDVGSFLEARAQEIVGGGLMALIISGLPDTASFSELTVGRQLELLGDCLNKMAKKGSIPEDKVNSLNMPVYFPSIEELEAIIEKNEHFNIERTAMLTNPRDRDPAFKPNLTRATLLLRAVFDTTISQHIGEDSMNELFDEYSKQVAEDSLFSNLDMITPRILVVILKRKGDD